MSKKKTDSYNMEKIDDAIKDLDRNIKECQNELKEVRKRRG